MCSNDKHNKQKKKQTIYKTVRSEQTNCAYNCLSIIVVVVAAAADGVVVVVIITVRLHVMQCMVLLSKFCPSVCPFVCQMRVL